MGTLLFDFLSDSLLFDDHRVTNHYGGVTDVELQKELTRYREFMISKLPELRAEISAQPSELRLFGAEDFGSLTKLVQAAFYLDQVVLPDPLFRHTQRHGEIKQHMNLMIGVKSPDEVDRKAVADAVRSMRQLTPMVAANYVKFFPVSYFLERKEVPIFFPGQDRFASSLPSDILGIYRQRTTVRSARITDQGAYVLKDLKPGRAISIIFDGASRSFLYRLQSIASQVFDEERRTVKFSMPLLGADEPSPTEEEFDAWVEQSINQSARAHFRDLWIQQSISSELDLSYLTGSDLTAALLGANAGTQDLKGFTADTILNLDVPFFSDMTADVVMSVRQSDGEAFHAFRRELEKSVRELRLESDIEKRVIKLENAMHELTEVQVGAVEQKVRQLKKGALTDAAIAVGGLAAGIATSGYSLVAVAVAAARGYKGWRDYQDKVALSPAYFLWKAKKRSR